MLTRERTAMTVIAAELAVVVAAIPIEPATMCDGRKRPCQRECWPQAANDGSPPSDSRGWCPEACRQFMPINRNPPE
jgi:hypothetical protein